MPFVPVGIYDYTDRLITTVESDYNGLADVLLPSTNRINCPTPSGVCANLYRFVGNDPGVPGRLNLNYNPQFRTIAAEFEVLPGLLDPGRPGADAGGRDRAAARRQHDHPAGHVHARRDDAAALCGVDQPYVNDSELVHDHGPRLRRAAARSRWTAPSCCPPTSWSDTQIDGERAGRHGRRAAAAHDHAPTTARARSTA